MKERKPRSRWTHDRLTVSKVDGLVRNAPFSGDLQLQGWQLLPPPSLVGKLSQNSGKMKLQGQKSQSLSLRELIIT
jgi:hypothetical protein